MYQVSISWYFDRLRRFPRRSSRARAANTESGGTGNRDGCRWRCRRNSGGSRIGKKSGELKYTAVIWNYISFIFFFFLEISVHLKVKSGGSLHGAIPAFGYIRIRWCGGRRRYKRKREAASGPEEYLLRFWWYADRCGGGTKARTSAAKDFELDGTGILAVRSIEQTAGRAAGHQRDNFHGSRKRERSLKHRRSFKSLEGCR